MPIDGYLILNDKGYRSATAELPQAQRIAAAVHGIWRHLIDEEYADKQAEAAYQRGIEEGKRIAKGIAE